MKFKKLVIVLGLISLFTVFNSNYIVLAEEGDLYDEFNDDGRLDDVPDWFIDIFKKYDYEYNTFHCGKWFDFDCQTANLIYPSLIGIIKTSHELLGTLVTTPEDVLESRTYNVYKNSLQTLSWSMLALFLLWNITKIYTTRLGAIDETGTATTEKVIKLVSMGIILGVYNQLFELVLTLSHMATSAVVTNEQTTKEMVVTFLIYGVFSGPLMLFILVVSLLIFALIFAYRSVLFGFLYIVGVIAIPTGLNDEYNYFEIWLRALINNAVNVFLQMLAYILAINMLIGLDTNILFFVAFLALAIAIPQYLGQLGQSSGTAKGVGSLVRTVAYRGLKK